MESKSTYREICSRTWFFESLHITGWVNNSISYIELFDVACLLSRWEGFGLALPEYMMVGKPIIATNIDAIPNLISNGKMDCWCPLMMRRLLAKQFLRFFG